MSVEPTIPESRSKEFFYDSIAESFDEVMNQYDVERRLAVVFDELLSGVDLRGRRLLDAGCGTGRFSAEAARRGANVVSVDIGPRLLRVVRGRCPSQVVCSDITRLAIPDKAFDLVISSECIEHTPAPAAAIAELLRVCRPGGMLAITCPNSFWHWSCTAANAIGLRPYDGLENWPGWFELRRWIKAAHGRVMLHKGVHGFPFVVQTLQPALRQLDRLGTWLGPVYVNQAVLATKLF